MTPSHQPQVHTDPDFYRPRDLALKKGVSRSKVFFDIAEGKLRAFRLDGCVVIRRSDAEEWFEARLVPITPKPKVAK